MLNEKLLINIFNKGIQNDKILGDNYKKRQIGVFIIYFLSIFLCKRLKVKLHRVGFINGSRGDEKLIENLYAEVPIIYNGSLFKNILEFKRRYTIFSKCTFIKRIKITIDAIKIYIHNNNKINSMLPDWLNYYSIYNFISLYVNESFISVGLKDRYSIWTSYLVNIKKVEYIVIQHGTVGNNLLPNKIICSKMYYISEGEKDLLKQYIVENNNCEYVGMNYISKIAFTKYATKNELFLIGIAEQKNPQFIFSIIDKLKRTNLDMKIIIMLHPLSKKIYYKKLKKEKKILVDSANKYINLDVLIVQTSTIVYDYLANNFRGKILRIKKSNNSIIGFDNDERVLKLNEGQLEEYIKNIAYNVGVK